VQREFDFNQIGTETGLEKWVAARRVSVQQLARQIHLPLGHTVEVWLVGGVRLRGKLRLKEEILFLEEERVRHLELRVENIPFFYREMESCVRLD